MSVYEVVLAFFLMVFLVIAENDHVLPKEVRLAEEVCAKHDGVRLIHATIGRNIDVVCNNGVKVERTYGKDE